MKNKINILFLLLATFIFACDDDDDGSFSGPYTLVVSGTHEVTPGDVEEFTLRDIDNPESFTWAVAEGPAEIVGAATGNKVTVEFHSVGEVVLTVTNGSDNGTVRIDVVNVPPAVTAHLNGTGVLRGGVSDTVFFEFDAALLNDPTIALATDSSAFYESGEPFVSGTLGDLVKVDAMNYYAIYTAGEGNGTPEVYIPELFATEAYGLDTLDSIFVQIYRVDNIDPLAELSYSQTKVNDSTEVTVTATFSEPVTYANSEDSAIYITFSGGGVETLKDTLHPTSDPLVYTADFVVNGEGAGPIQVDISNAVDYAGNMLGLIDNSSELEVDNLEPMLVAQVTDDGDFATIQIASNENGTGYYLIVEDGETAPTTPEEFMEYEEAISSGSVDLVANNPASAVSILESGAYDVYFIAHDEAGNYSEITTEGLMMD